MFLVRIELVLQKIVILKVFGGILDISGNNCNIGVIHFEMQNADIVFFLADHIFELAVNQQTSKNILYFA